MSRCLPLAFDGACFDREQRLQDRLATARADVLSTYDQCLAAKASEPETALHEAESRLREIETELDAIAAELAE